MDVIKAWRDPVYRASLTDAERQDLPTHPSGLIELTDIELDLNRAAADGARSAIPCGVTFAAGRFTFNTTLCNGSCALVSVGCCGGG